MKARRLIPMLLAVAMAAPTAIAQDPDRTRERERAEAARQQLEEAQARLEQALERLSRAQSEEANREMQRAMDALRRAQREFQQDLYQGLMRDYVTAIGENAYRRFEVHAEHLVGHRTLGSGGVWSRRKRSVASRVCPSPGGGSGFPDRDVVRLAVPRSGGW